MMSRATPRDPMAIKIRKAAPADLKALVAMVGAHNAEAGNGAASLDLRRFRAALFGKNAFVFCDLAEAVGEGANGASTPAAAETIGYALSHDCFTTDDGTRGVFLTDRFVESAWRREGAGRLLVEAVTRRAKARGATHVWWASMAKNYQARRFYGRLGATDERVHAHALFGEPFSRLTAKR